MGNQNISEKSEYEGEIYDRNSLDINKYLQSKVHMEGPFMTLCPQERYKKSSVKTLHAEFYPLKCLLLDSNFNYYKIGSLTSSL